MCSEFAYFKGVHVQASINRTGRSEVKWGGRGGTRRKVRVLLPSQQDSPQSRSRSGFGTTTTGSRGSRKTPDGDGGDRSGVSDTKTYCRGVRVGKVMLPLIMTVIVVLAVRVSESGIALRHRIVIMVTNCDINSIF